MDLHTYLARKELERDIASSEAWFRHEWNSLRAARRLEERLSRERGRLEISAPHVCCGRRSHANGGLA
jgi:hypothetical protein